MQLTLYTDYSLRVLIFLGIRPETQTTITEIAEHYKISRNHLVKVVHNLSNLGYIKTLRGRGGGMLLAYRPEEINIGEVVRQTEQNFNIVECFDRENNCCPIAPVCALITPLKEARESFLAVLDRYNLGDVVQNGDELASFLHMAPEVKSVSLPDPANAKSK